MMTTAWRSSTSVAVYFPRKGRKTKDEGQFTRPSSFVFRLSSLSCCSAQAGQQGARLARAERKAQAKVEHRAA
jgi:hypothetical protein